MYSSHRYTEQELKEIGTRDYHLKIIAVCLSLVIPIFIALFGDFYSLSKSWGTSFMPLFIINNAISSYYLFSMRRWRLPAFFLLMLTGFPVWNFSVIHKIFAVAFFVSCIYSLGASRKMRAYFWCYLLTTPIFFWSILWGEVAATMVLTLYHLHSLVVVREILKTR